MAKRPSRRQFLGFAAVGLAGLAGCNQLQSSSEQEKTTIVDAHIVNKYPEPRELSVLFERNGELAYWRTFEVEAEGRNDNGPETTDVPITALSEEPAEWTIKVLNTDAGTFKTATPRDDRGTEVRMKITINANDEIEFMVGH